MTEDQIRVLLADDHPLIREGIGNTLRRDERLSLVGVATNGEETQRLVADLQPDILLLDLNMPGAPPLETVAVVGENCPQTQILVLSAFNDFVSVRALLRAGVSGYVLKDEAIGTVVRAIRTVVDGGTWFSSDVAQQLAEPEVSAPAFTERENEVLHHLARGWSNRRMAEELDVTERTVRFHLKNIYRKLDVDSRGEAIVWAVQAGYGRE